MPVSFFQSFDTNIVHVIGVACKIVTLFSIIAFFNLSISINILFVPITIVAPIINGRNISIIDISKLIVVNDNKISSLYTGNSLLISIKKFNKFSYVICTPLGFPVDPDVYIT